MTHFYRQLHTVASLHFLSDIPAWRRSYAVRSVRFFFWWTKRAIRASVIIILAFRDPSRGNNSQNHRRLYFYSVRVVGALSLVVDLSSSAIALVWFIDRVIRTRVKCLSSTLLYSSLLRRRSATAHTELPDCCWAATYLHTHSVLQRSTTMADYDLNVDSLIQRLLEGKYIYILLFLGIYISYTHIHTHHTHTQAYTDTQLY